MAAATVVNARLARIGYDGARRLLIVTGAVVIGVLTLLLMVRSVDRVEVGATVLFIPLFLAVMYFGVVGGVIGAVVATAIYIGLRLPAIDAVGADDFLGVIVSRGFAYLLFGLIGGIAAGTLEGSLDKLELYDEIDDRTGLFNARAMVHAVALERSRATRYKHLFSVCEVRVPASVLDGLPRRKSAAVLRELGRKLTESARTVDKVCFGHDGETLHFAAILPETGAEGAGIFEGRFEVAITGFLAERLGTGTVAAFSSMSTFPSDDTSGLDELVAIYRSMDEAEHGAAHAG